MRSMIVLGISTVLVAGCAADTRLGVPGETCTARNDCRADLACIRGVCMSGTTGLTVTGRSCYRVECMADGDCCAAFTPDAACDTYHMQCMANPMDCGTYNTLCVCNRQCNMNICIDLGPTCTADANCVGVGSRFCVSSRCVNCRSMSDCGAGNMCVNGSCVAGCVRDENCGLLQTCVAGACTDSGCVSDRECAFILGTGRAVCQHGQCSVNCTADAECDTAHFEICSSGNCVFAGCTSDAECRVVLGLEHTMGSVRAVCR